MTSSDNKTADPQFLTNTMTSFLRIGAVLVLLYWCVTILSPFFNIVIWAAILSIAVYPWHQSISARLGGRPKTSATLLVLVGLAIIIIPTWLFADSSIDSLRNTAQSLRAGSVTLQQPDASVAEWPVKFR